MNNYVTGKIIRTLREDKGLTQAALADLLGVTSKAVSKWETAKGLPDVSLLEPLASALGVSVTELMNGERIVNHNKCANLLRSRFHVCPVCGNALLSLGDASISCCGLILPVLEAEDVDAQHSVIIEAVEDESYVTVSHEMTKEHYISFLCYVTGDRSQFVKFYPEGNAETRLQLRGRGILYLYCNRHGLMRVRV